MIDIKDLKQTDVGRTVKYASFNNVEYGRISSWNDKYVFVRYGIGITAAATNPRDLEWAANGEDQK